MTSSGGRSFGQLKLSAYILQKPRRGAPSHTWAKPAPFHPHHPQQSEAPPPLVRLLSTRRPGAREAKPHPWARSGTLEDPLLGLYNLNHAVRAYPLHQAFHHVPSMLARIQLRLISLSSSQSRAFCPLPRRRSYIICARLDIPILASSSAILARLLPDSSPPSSILVRLRRGSSHVHSNTFGLEALA